MLTLDPSVPLRPFVLITRVNTPEYGGEDHNIFFLVVNPITVRRCIQLHNALAEVKADRIMDYFNCFSVLKYFPEEYRECAFTGVEGFRTGMMPMFLLDSHSSDGHSELEDDYALADDEVLDPDDDYQSYESGQMQVYGDDYKFMGVYFTWYPKHAGPGSKCNSDDITLPELVAMAGGKLLNDNKRKK
jgi:hypothetical protein